MKPRTVYAPLIAVIAIIALLAGAAHAASVSPSCPIDLATMYNVIGDGTDESGKLASAISYAAAHPHCTIVFPEKKTIVVNSALYTGAYTEIDGRGSTLKVADGYGTASTVLSLGDYNHVHNLRFDGNRYRIDQSKLGVIDSIRLGTWNIFENNEVFGTSAYSVHAYRAANSVIRNNFIHDGKQYGIATGGNLDPYPGNLSIYDNTIWNMTEIGIKLRAVRDSKISNNTIMLLDGPGFGGTGIRLYSNDFPTSNVLITGNKISGDFTNRTRTGDGYAVGIGADAPPNPGAVIENNIINSTYWGIDLGTNGITVRNNQIRNSRFSGIYVTGNDNQVSDNALVNAGIMIGSQYGPYTGSANTFRRNSVEGGNGYWRADGDGIYLWFNASGNIFDFNTVGAERYGFNVNNTFGTVSNTRITNNVITAERALCLDLGSGTVLSNNTAPSVIPRTEPGIRVTAPDGGQNWIRGSAQTITWSYTGDPGSNVRIELLRGASVNMVITGNAPIGSGGAGSYVWTVPANQPVQTDYRIRISGADNPLVNDTSNANFTISAAAPVPASITVTTPNGGQNYTRGTTQTISWGHNVVDSGSSVKIELLRGASVNMVITENAPVGSGGLGSYQWTISDNQPIQTDYRIRITSTDNPLVNDTSNANFIISSAGQVPAPITVTAPNGGQNWTRGSAQTITWSHTLDPGTRVRIELLRGDVLVRVINSSAPIGTTGAGSYAWIVPYNQSPADNYRIRITSTGTPSVSDTGNADFTINAGAPLTVTTPNGGQDWARGSKQVIRWKYTGNPGARVKIYLFKGGVLNRVISAGTSIGAEGAGSFSWTVPPRQAPGTDYRIRIISTVNTAYVDMSNADFAIHI